MFQLFDRPALRDVLGAVPVEGCQVDDDDALGAGFVVEEELMLPFGGVVPRDVLDISEDLEARLMRVVHEEECGAGVGTEVAGGDVLAVAGNVGVGDGAVVDDVEEAGRPAAELDVGPSGLADGGDVEAVAAGDEVFFEVAEGVVGGAALGEFFVGRATAHLALDCCYFVCESEGGELMGHVGLAFFLERWTRALWI